jgi:CheY-like chemotaxis protein
MNKRLRTLILIDIEASNMDRKTICQKIKTKLQLKSYLLLSWLHTHDKK